MKHPGIGQLRILAEKDLTISDGALRLLLRLCSYVYVDPRRRADDEFALPWSQVAVWCGLDDQKAAYRRIVELSEPGRPGGPYIEKSSLKGCPATQFYRLNLSKKSPSVTRHSSPEKGGTGSPKNGATVTPEKRGTSSPDKTRHQISSSLRNKDFKKEEENNGSLRSSVTSGGNNSSSAVAPSKCLTAAERSEEIRRLRELLT